MYGLAQKIVAEFLGTFGLVLAITGAICTDKYSSEIGGASTGLLGIALVSGIAYAIMISALGHISGAHLNPAVTIGFWVTKRLGTLDALAYWVAQLAGAASASYFLAAILPETALAHCALGTPELAAEFGRMRGMALEGVFTFLLVFVFFATSVDSSGAFAKIGGFATGLVLTVATIIATPFTGAALNPARAFAPALAAHHHWSNQGVYWVGPLFGGILGAVIYERVFLRDQPPI